MQSKGITFSLFNHGNHNNLYLTFIAGEYSPYIYIFL